MAKNKKTRKVTPKRNQAAKRMRVMSKLPTANRKYKDTVFRMLKSLYSSSLQKIPAPYFIVFYNGTEKEEGILKDFLQENRAEVIAMSIFEYNKEEEDKKLRKAEYEAGYDSGYDTGYGSGFDAGKQEIIQAMLKAGEPLEKIAQYTGYAVEEIKDRIKNFR